MLTHNLQNVHIEIVNLLGKQVYSDIIDYKLELGYSIDLNQPAGTYIVTLTNEKYCEETIIIID